MKINREKAGWIFLAMLMASTLVLLLKNHIAVGIFFLILFSLEYLFLFSDWDL